jgi:hypothetical protein
MATYINADVERIEDTTADLTSRMRAKQTSFENDGTQRIVHKYNDGSFKYWVNSDEMVASLSADFAAYAHNHHTLVSEGELIDPVVCCTSNGLVSIANISGVTPSAIDFVPSEKPKIKLIPRVPSNLNLTSPTSKYSSKIS